MASRMKPVTVSEVQIGVAAEQNSAADGGRDPGFSAFPVTQRGRRY